MKPLRLLIAIDQLLVRAGIRELLKPLLDVTVVGEATDGHQALRLIKSHQPDIVLMDSAMPGLNGLEATVISKKRFSSVKVIIISEQSTEDFVLRALNSGAEGFVLKDGSVEELYAAIESVAQGGEYLSTQITKPVMLESLEGRQNGKELEQFTPRQLQVLQLIAEGKSSKEIAHLLDVSVNTVKTHRLKLMEKLDVHEITGVVRYAAKWGLINQ